MTYIILFVLLSALLISGCDSAQTSDMPIESPLPSDVIEISINANANSSAYRWLPLTSGHDEIADPSIDDPTILLTQGQRYRIKNPQFRSHPLELRGDRGEFLLSQKHSGDYEQDLEINWVEINEGTEAGNIEFTVTDALAVNLSKYSCFEHATMNGDIKIIQPPTTDTTQ